MTRTRFHLLPREPFAKVAYVWLVYLGSPLAYPLFAQPRDTSVIAWTVIAVALFLPLYFVGYWVNGTRALAVIVAIAAIGALLTPWNAGGATFFIYAGAFAHRVGRPRTAVMVLVGVLLALLVEASLGGMARQTWLWAAILTPAIGALNIYMVETARTLRVAQDEARHLAVVAERERIGRDLHDLLGHTLSVITLKAELASKLATRDIARSITEIRDVERISRDALAEVRRAVQGMGTVALADEVTRARTALESVGAVLECNMAGVTLPPTGEHALALSIREAVTNIIRHANARRCEIRLVATNAEVRLDIHDDGRGGDAHEGSGLLGMRARIVALGGRLERDGRAGTRLTITLPTGASPDSKMVRT